MFTSLKPIRSLTLYNEYKPTIVKFPKMCQLCANALRNVATVPPYKIGPLMTRDMFQCT